MQQNGNGAGAQRTVIGFKVRQQRRLAGITSGRWPSGWASRRRT